MYPSRGQWGRVTFDLPRLSERFVVTINYNFTMGSTTLSDLQSWGLRVSEYYRSMDHASQTKMFRFFLEAPRGSWRYLELDNLYRGVFDGQLVSPSSPVDEFTVTSAGIIISLSLVFNLAHLMFVLDGLDVPIISHNDNLCQSEPVIQL